MSGNGNKKKTIWFIEDDGQVSFINFNVGVSKDAEEYWYYVDKLVDGVGLVESRKNPSDITITPVIRQKPFFFVESFRSFTMHTRRTTATTAAVIITPGFRRFSTPPLSGMTTY